MYSAPRAILFALLASLSVVNAHGTVSGFESNGRKWPAPLPNSNRNMDSPVREIRTLEPQMNLRDPAMGCGPGAKPSARAVAEVTAGSRVGFSWTSGGFMRWPHCHGPVMLYAYRCPGSARDCRPPSDNSWFLIDAAGFDPENNRGDCEGWMQNRFRQNRTVFANVPRGMQNGEYLFRHEIVAMHVATSRGSEHYISCTQVRVIGGSNTSARAGGAEMVSFPGTYIGDSRVRQNVFSNSIRRDFRMPGPRLYRGPSGNQNGGNGTDATNTTRPPQSTPPTPTSTRTSSPSNGGVINIPVPTQTGPVGRPGRRCRAKNPTVLTRSLDSGELISVARRHA